MIWNVIIHDNGRVRAFNIFDNKPFRMALQTDIFNIPELSFREVEKIVRNLVHWQFWGRCEYEHLIYEWPRSTKDKGYKIDVCEQLLMNWERFIEYIYSEYCFRQEEINNE